MPMRRPGFVLLASMALASVVALSPRAEGAKVRFAVTYPADRRAAPLDGRLLLLLSTDKSEEPRTQITDNALRSQQVFGIDVDGWKAGTEAVFQGDVLGFPTMSLAEIPPGTYQVQALLHRYETFRRADGHTVKLPMDRGEGQQWSKAPGNLYSTPREITLDPARAETIRIALDQVIPPIPDPRRDKVHQARKDPVGAADEVLGTADVPRRPHPAARGLRHAPGSALPARHQSRPLPLHARGLPARAAGPESPPRYSERFHVEGYNRIEQELAHAFYKDWTGPGYPRYLLVEIQHANPFYDDSYAVNSQNLGPYGDAITHELIPYLEKKYRALGGGWARFVYGGSTGGWESLAAQILYPDEYNGCWAACPDPIDFHAYMTVNIYDQPNAYFWSSPWTKIATPAHRDYLGHLQATIEQQSRFELVVGERTRSGGQLDIWEAVYSPVGPDGYPMRIWDRRTGVIDKSVAAFWKENYDLVDILKRNWSKGLGQKLVGKDPHLRGRSRQLLPQQRRVPGGGFSPDGRPVLRRRDRLRSARRALLERRPPAAEPHLEPALRPDVRAEDRGTDRKERPAGR